MRTTAELRPPRRWMTKRNGALLIGGIAAGVAGAIWWGDEAPYPYAQRWMLDLPLPFLTNGDLDRALAPKPGERVLEIGPGTGLQALHVAPQLAAGGRLDVVDVQQPMLDHVARRAARRGITNIVPTKSDARELPFEDNTFDAVYLITALGEIPEPKRALREAARTTAPGGRIVVGEFFDPHWISPNRLRDYAEDAGLLVDSRRGVSLAYLARLRASSFAA